MNFLEKLDYMMEKMSINKSKLSQISGVPYTTIDGFYKKGYENTKISTIKKIASALNVSLDYLVDDDISDERYNPPKIKTAPSDISEEAHQVARDYDGLDSHGRTVTRLLISEEQKRMAAERRRNEADNPAVEVMARSALHAELDRHLDREKEAAEKSEVS